MAKGEELRVRFIVWEDFVVDGWVPLYLETEAEAVSFILGPHRGRVVATKVIHLAVNLSEGTISLSPDPVQDQEGPDPAEMVAQGPVALSGAGEVAVTLSSGETLITSDRTTIRLSPNAARQLLRYLSGGWGRVASW